MSSYTEFGQKLVILHAAWEKGWALDWQLDPSPSSKEPYNDLLVVAWEIPAYDYRPHDLPDDYPAIRQRFTLRELAQWFKKYPLCQFKFATPAQNFPSIITYLVRNFPDYEDTFRHESFNNGHPS